MEDLAKLKTQVALLQKDAKTGEQIHQRLEIAIEKLTDITVSLKGMLVQQETKLAKAEEVDNDIFILLESRRKEWDNDLKELHSRITTNTKEIMSIATQQHKEHTDAIQKLHKDINKRVGVLEKWRHVLIGSSIVVGFILHRMMDFT